MKKICLLALLIACFVSGCTFEKDKGTTNVNGTTTIKQTIVADDFDRNGSGMLKCTTEAEAGENIDVDLKYNVSYKNGNILNLVSIQKVTSSEKESLDLYENAYADIARHYAGLEHYNTDIVRDSNSVTYTITINYNKIDINKLLDIEGADDNIIKNGKANLFLWLDLAEGMGTVCEEA